MFKKGDIVRLKTPDTAMVEVVAVSYKDRDMLVKVDRNLNGYKYWAADKLELVSKKPRGVRTIELTTAQRRALRRLAQTGMDYLPQEYWADAQEHADALWALALLKDGAKRKNK